jgi:hypothetical protein
LQTFFEIGGAFMLLKVKRTQKTAIGLLRTNVPYEFDLKNPAHKKTLDALEARGLVEKTTIKDLKKSAQAGAAETKAKSK